MRLTKLMARSRDELEVADIPLNSGKKKGFRISTFAFIIYLAMASLITVLVMLGLFSDCIADKRNEAAAEFNLDATVMESSKRRVDVRLPKNVVPFQYGLKIIPYFFDKNFTFDGEVTIVINVTEDTNEVMLHASELLIQEELTFVREFIGENAKGTELKIKRQYNNSIKQFHVIETSENLRAGKQYIVYLKYTGKLNDDLRGFYRSSYVVNNQTKWLAATQFQPTDARFAFPCFDEPALKAKFQISLARPANMTAISNMPKLGESRPVLNVPNYEWDDFQESVPMSTYLVAFIVSDLDKRGTSDGKFAVWARKEAIDQSTYALSVGPRLLRYFEDYFKIAFPLPKIDMVALPDFPSGAMENWGLITYRETAMLYQQGVSTNSNKQRVAVVISHELSHQWFGNLVTPSWWSDLWLNEGFASYMENIGTDAVEPEWKALEKFVVSEMQDVLKLDALESSHPVSIPVGHPDEINEIFDRISYSKAGSLIRMMDHFLTTEVFKRGLTNYLNERKYSSAQQDDLWSTLTRQAHDDKVLDLNVTVKMIMDSWTLQTGYPVITVTRNYNLDSATVKQDRFVLRNITVGKKSLWWIPITYTTAEKGDFQNTKPVTWMRAQPQITIKEVGAKPNEWLIFNNQETGYYRVNYDQENWKLIIQQLRSPDFRRISSINRAQLIDDALELAKAGYLDYSIALNVTSYLYQETEYFPWSSALTVLDFLDKMLVRSHGYDLFRAYSLKLLSNVYREVGFKDSPGDPHLTVLTRVAVLNWACRLGYEDCIRNAISQFEMWRRSPNPDLENPISPNLKSVVYCTAIKYGGLAEWEFAWNRYLATNVGSEKDLLLGALGCSRETWILSRYLDWAMSEKSGIRKQDVGFAVRAVSNTVIGQPLAFNYFISKWKHIMTYFGTSQTLINFVVKSFTKRISSKRQLTELLDFAKDHIKELGSATRTITQVVEQAQTNIQWLQRYHGPIYDWLKKNS